LVVQALAVEETKARDAQRHDKAMLKYLESEHAELSDSSQYTARRGSVAEEDASLQSEYERHQELLRQDTKRVKEFSERRSAPLSRFVTNAHLIADDDWGVITRFFAYKNMRGTESNEMKILSLCDHSSIAEELFELLVGRLG
jgi:hypothetical protein